MLADYCSNLFIRAMAIAFLLLFLAILLSVFQLHRFALVVAVVTLSVVSFGALVLYMQLPLGGA